MRVGRGSTRGGIGGGSSEKNFEIRALLGAFLMGFVCVCDQILVALITIFC